MPRRIRFPRFDGVHPLLRLWKANSDSLHFSAHRERGAFGKGAVNVYCHHFSLARDDFGVATGHLAAALGDDPTAAASEHARGLERLLRLAERRGHGERLIAWFEESGFADRLAPVHAAFVAYVRGGAGAARRQSRSQAAGPDPLRPARRATPLSAIEGAKSGACEARAGKAAQVTPLNWPATGS